MRLWAVISCAALLGCAPTLETPPSIPFEFDASGVDLPGLGQRIDFGRTQASTIFAMQKILGQPPELASCGSGAVALWPGRASLIFVDITFAGWRTSSAQAGAVC